MLGFSLNKEKRENAVLFIEKNYQRRNEKPQQKTMSCLFYSILKFYLISISKRDKNLYTTVF